LRGPDASNTFTYTLVSGIGSTDNASFTIDGSTLKTAASFNFEANSSYSIRVRSTDQGSLSTEKVFTITVTAVNDFTPVFTSGIAGTVAEGAPTSTVIYAAVATDADGTALSNAVTYSIKPLFDAAYVTIDPATGQVTLKNPATLQVKASYTFVVFATDGGTPSRLAEQGVTVTVTEKNLRTPAFTSSGIGSVAEMAPTSEVIYKAVATDADSTAPNNVVHYSIKPGVDNAALVTINAQTGEVTLKSPADFESKLSYSFTVVATDGGNPSLAAEQTVTVAVTNVAPTATAVAIAPRGYKAGDTIVVAVTFTEPVVLTGAAQIGLTVGTTLRQAVYTGGSGRKSLSFRYVVAAGDLSVQGVVLSSTVALNSGWIRDAVGNPARLTLPAVNTRNVLVDAVPPSVTGLTIPVAATYKKGQTLSFTVTFSEAVLVTGVPRLQAVIGTTVRSIAYVRGTGTKSLVFSYKIQATDHDADGIALQSQIVLDTGTIRDKGGNPTILTLPSIGTSGVKVS